MAKAALATVRLLGATACFLVRNRLIVYSFLVMQVPFPSLEMPAEPAFDAFIRKNNLLPVSRDVRDSMEQVQTFACCNC